MEKIVLISLPMSEFQAIIVDCVKACIQHQPKNSDKPAEQIMTRDEVCDLLQITKSTLWKRTKSGKLKAYEQGRRVYYKRSEVLESLTPLKNGI